MAFSFLFPRFPCFSEGSITAPCMGRVGELSRLCKSFGKSRRLASGFERFQMGPKSKSIVLSASVFDNIHMLDRATGFSFVQNPIP